MGKAGLLLGLMLLAGCGPVLIAEGVRAALDTSDPDLGEPTVEVEALDADGDEIDPPEFANDSLRFRFRVGKPGVRLSALVIGPIPSGAAADDVDTIERDFGRSAITPKDASVPTSLFTNLPKEPGDGSDLTRYLDNAADGTYRIVLRGEDAQNRSDFDSHTWVYDTKPPSAPRLISVEARKARQLDVSWIVSTDDPADATAAASGVRGYLIYFDVGAAKVPDDPRTATPAFDGRAKFDALSGSTGDSPVFVNASDSGTFTLTGLFGLRQHYVRVTAVDRAGNESDLATANEVKARTRAGGDGTFRPGISIEPGVSDWLQGPIVADVDRDGHDDIVVRVLDPLQGFLPQVGRVLYGDGDGSFPDSADFNLSGARGFPPAMADLNLDGFLDYWYVGERKAQIRIGSGVRATPFPKEITVEHRYSSTAWGISVGDVNHDLVPDGLLLGFSEGTYMAVPAIGHLPPDADPWMLEEFLGQTGPFPVTGGPRLAFADLDEDGEQDIVIAGDTAIAVQLRNPGAYFQRPVEYASGGSPSDMSVLDLDSDGHLDVVVLHHDGSLGVLPGNGDGSFGAAIGTLLGTQGGRLAHGDFNADGRADLAVAGAVDFTVNVLLGRGDGTFEFGQAAVRGGHPSAISVGDFNGDGIEDLAVALALGGLDVLIGNGARVVWDGTVRRSPVFVPTGPGLTSGDFNGDGVPDLAMPDEVEPRIRVRFARAANGQFAGGYRSEMRFREDIDPVDGLTSKSNALVAVDVDGDGLLDIVGNGDAADFNNPAKTILPALLSNGAGGFLPSRLLPLTWGAAGIADIDPCEPDQSGQSTIAGAEVRLPAYADFDGDGTLDFAAIVKGPDGRYGIRTAKSSMHADCPWTGVAAGDIDGDGKPDLVGCNGHRGVVNIMLGNGDGTFRGSVGTPEGTWVPPADGFAAGKNPKQPIVADFNGDGILDVALRNDSGIRILHGQRASSGRADGTLGEAIDFSAGEAVDGMAAADIDRDGSMDLVYVLRTSEDWDLRVIRSGRTGYVDAELTAEIGSAFDLTVADFNSDGIPDVATSNDIYYGAGVVVDE